MLPTTFSLWPSRKEKVDKKKRSSGSAPDPRHLLKKVDENFILGEEK